MPKLTWLALGYNVPVNPSKNRVYVWRKLKEFGAGYFKQGVALLPGSQQNMAKFRQLSIKIREMGGEATIAELKFCDSADEKDTIERFRAQADSEYRELLRDCAGLMDNLQSLFSAAERKERLRKVVRRYKQAQSRDYFMAGARSQLKSALDELAEDIGELF